MIYEVDPLNDPRWPEFLQSQAQASAFHTPGWLRSLRDTYGFLPTVITTSPPTSTVNNGVVFCRVLSWVTGRRLVSIPYSDHCEPLLDLGDVEEVLTWIASECRHCGYRYVEMRPLRFRFPAMPDLQPSERFDFHWLDLHRDLDSVYAAFDKKCIQGRIRRAAREGLTWELGRSESLLASFYQLMVLTRRRHQLPPQPIDWYRNLIHCMGDAVTIHLLRKDERAVAGILTVGYKHSLIVKYSCSDQAFKSVGATPLLFWRVIEHAKRAGFLELDLGRCAPDDEGLATFKTRLGANASELAYWRYPVAGEVAARCGWKVTLAKQVFSYMPQSLLSASGRVLYKHFG